MSRKWKPYKDHYDISYNIEEGIRDHIAVIIAVSADDQRGCGKTFSTSRWLYERYLKEGKRFMLFVREVKSLGKIAEGCFGAMLAKNYPDVSIYEKSQDNVFSTIYQQIGTGKEKKTDVIGFVSVLKRAGDLKYYRGIFERANVKAFWMDEFMPKDNRYLTGEADLMKTAIDTVNGEVEDLPIILTANCLTLGNPYFTMLGLNSKIQSSTHKIKTSTCIYENVVVEGLTEKHINSAINRAFGANTQEYLDNVWINDENSLVVGKPEGWGRPIYICGINYSGTTYGVYAYPDVGLYYVSTTYDASIDCVYALTLDGKRNIPLLKNNRTVCNLRNWYYDGVVRVQHGGIQRMLREVFG